MVVDLTSMLRSSTAAKDSETTRDHGSKKTGSQESDNRKTKPRSKITMMAESNATFEDSFMDYSTT
jgi:hypothetical protein